MVDPPRIGRESSSLILGSASLASAPSTATAPGRFLNLSDLREPRPSRRRRDHEPLCARRQQPRHSGPPPFALVRAISDGPWPARFSILRSPGSTAGPQHPGLEAPRRGVRCLLSISQELTGLGQECGSPAMARDGSQLVRKWPISGQPTSACC